MTNQAANRFIRVFPMLLLPFLFSCLTSQTGRGRISLSEYSAQHSTASCSGGYQEFRTGFYAYAKTLHCVGCHSAIQSPLWLASDPASAYLAAKTKLTAASPLSSKLLSQAKNDHSGAALTGAPLQEYQNKLVSWATAEVTCTGSSGGGGSSSTPTPVPTAGPTVERACSPANLVSFLVKVYSARFGYPNTGFAGNDPNERRCLLCHGPGSNQSNAYNSFDLRGDDYSMCVNTARKLNRTDINQSVLVTRVQPGANTACFFRDGFLIPEERASWLSWAAETVLLAPPP